MTDLASGASAPPPDYFAGDPRTNHERMLAGDLYIADDPAIFEEQKKAARLSAEFLAAYNEDPGAGQHHARRLFGSLDETAFVRAPVYVDYGSHITIGPRTFVNMGLTALDVAPITIGADCQIGPHVQLLTPTHPVEPQPRRDKLEAARPITIGDNVWLGGGVIVCPGVSIGDNSVVGAGSVVTRDIPANALAVGNPARVLRSL
ncbi:sugar O-acetyltransferase [Streptomyces litchfieldiae]|uniref:Sugar O-acetyltransferase n=1 Tax=Streptomyces litchfieldiae TaxID=3075543 RepID=A0ABU2MQW5_9ACTN|nr:sugar O-acetyltransferase [Streptomyces sp. DSM 44938]MDT0343905.1 sugar O-acetyltransferase [Streptomyces sp. DSM 44938]